MKIILFIGSLILTALGIILFGLGMLSLGWGVHGASLLDFSFLHLDWIFQPELPQWRAHMSNLATAFAGLLLMVAPMTGLVWYRARKRSRREQSQS